MRMPIRPGCFIELTQTFRNGDTRDIAGTVFYHEYRGRRHYFKIRSAFNPRHIIELPAKVVYNNIKRHIPGEWSLIEKRRSHKKYAKFLKKERERIRRGKAKRRRPPKRRNN